MKLLNKLQIENLSIYILSLALIFSPFFIFNCATVSGSASYCDQIAEISRTATLLLCEALSRPDTDSAKSPTNTLHSFTRVVAGDTVSFLSHINKSGGAIISWHSRHNPGGAILIEPLPTLAELDSLRN
jgi:hypothetical protein